MKKTLISLSLSILSLILLLNSCVYAFGMTEDVETLMTETVMELSSQSAFLMEAETGQMLYEQNSTEHLEPASVTKIMSVLLIMEAIDSGVITLDDTVTASEYAASMGGSQIWLEYGEQFTVDEMLKAIMIVSANDCTVAMAEHLCGSEEAFVTQMNARAKELSMNDTSFKNSTGLPEEGHYTCARDIAIMTRELMKHEKIFDYTTVWMDSLRGGEMGLTNTNKLIRFYKGANGMKTGFTSSAQYCMSATAQRDEMGLIAVVMKAPSSDKRFEDAKKLLDYGFANFTVYKVENKEMPSVKVLGGDKNEVKAELCGTSILMGKGKDKLVEETIMIEDEICAPVEKGQIIGNAVYSINGEEIAELNIIASENVKKITFSQIWMKILTKLIMFR